MSVLFFISLLFIGQGPVPAQKIVPAAVLQPAAIDAAALTVDVDLRLQHLQKQVSGASFCIKKIEMGDNLWKIASKRGYTVHSILGCNPQMKTYEVYVNQRVILPSRGGTLHQIQDNDTWDSIAKRYDITAEKLVKCNGGAGSLTKGAFIFVPGRMPDRDLMNPEMQKKYEIRAMFASPLGGRLTSDFGSRRHPVTGKESFHGGIDLAVPIGTWVGAAAEGVVTLAGDTGGHYGKAVFIDHGNKYITHYGHLSKVHVRVGQRVKARQLIAKSGSTGRSTGPHLHFTIKKDGANINPSPFLW